MSRNDFGTRFKPVYRPRLWMFVAAAVLWAIGYLALAIVLRITGHA